MYSPWQMQFGQSMWPMPMMGHPHRPHAPHMMMMPTGAFPVPESLPPESFPPAVRESIARLFMGPPKPAVTLPVMNETQASMIAPDLPFRAAVKK